MSKPAQYNISINVGEDYSQTFVWANASQTPYNLTGYTARFQARATQGSSTTILDSGGASPTTGLTVTVDTVNNKIIVAMTAACTRAITSNGVYSLRIVSGSSVAKRLVEGTLTLEQETNR